MEGRQGRKRRRSNGMNANSSFGLFENSELKIQSEEHREVGNKR